MVKEKIIPFHDIKVWGVYFWHTFHQFQHCLNVELRTWKLRLDCLWLCSFGKDEFTWLVFEIVHRQVGHRGNYLQIWIPFFFRYFVKGCWKCSHSILERLWWCLQILCTRILERLKQENCWKLVRFSHPMEDHICYATLLQVHTLCINWNLSC